MIYSSLPTSRSAITVTHFSLCPEFLNLTSFPGIRALPNLGNPDQTYANSTNVAILHYVGALGQTPSTDSNENVPESRLPLVETNLHVGTL